MQHIRNVYFVSCDFLNSFSIPSSFLVELLVFLICSIMPSANGESFAFSLPLLFFLVV